MVSDATDESKRASLINRFESDIEAKKSTYAWWVFGLMKKYYIDKNLVRIF